LELRVSASKTTTTKNPLTAIDRGLKRKQCDRMNLQIRPVVSVCGIHLRVLFCWYESCPHHVIGTIKTRIPVFQPQFLQGLPFMLMNSSHSPRKGVGAVVCSHTMQVWLKMVCTLIFGRIHISYIHFGYQSQLEQIGEPHSELGSRRKSGASALRR
jgi:hypothetical protein